MSGQSIRVSWTGGDRTFAPGQDVSIGRDAASVVRLDDERVSRRHAELRSTEGGWLLVDLGSTSGTFVGDERVTELLIRRPTSVRFGGLHSADEVRFHVDSAPEHAVAPAGATEVEGGRGPSFPAPRTARPPVPATEAADAPVMLDGPSRPGGRLAPNAAVGATEVVDQSVSVQFGAHAAVAHPGQSLTLGRDPEADLRSDNPTISRHHARIRFEAGEWWLEDLGSSRGTFADGRKITKQKLTGSMVFTLGPAGAGERLVTVAAGEAPRSLARAIGRRRTAVATVAAVAVAALLVISAVVVVGRLDGGGGPDVDELRAATVYITAGDFTGSGSIIDGERGLILTNAHVVAPDSPGQGVVYPRDAFDLPEPPDQVMISLSQEADQPAEPAYFAEVVAADGYLDLAVVRITETIGGRIVQDGDLDLPAVAIGDSREIDQNDRLTVIGYPGIAETNSSNKVDGSVSGFVPDDRLGDNRAWINSDVRINRGDSGGLAADNDGELVAVPTMKQSDSVDSISRLRPIHLAEAMIAAAKEGTEYTSELVTPADEERIVGDDEPGTLDLLPATPGPLFASSCRDRIASSWSADRALSFAFEYSGFPDEHQDVLVTVQVGDRVIGQIASGDDYPFEWGGEGCAAVTVPLDVAVPVGESVTVYIDAGPNYERSLLASTFTL